MSTSSPSSALSVPGVHRRPAPFLPARRQHIDTAARAGCWRSGLSPARRGGRGTDSSGPCWAPRVEVSPPSPPGPRPGRPPTRPQTLRSALTGRLGGPLADRWGAVCTLASPLRFCAPQLWPPWPPQTLSSVLTTQEAPWDPGVSRRRGRKLFRGSELAPRVCP